MPGDRKNPTSLRYIMRQPGRGDDIHLYYRRRGKLRQLPGPEGSAAFLTAYDKIHAEFEGGGSRHAVRAAIAEYLDSVAYTGLADASRRNYALYLGEMRDRAGHLELSDISVQWVDRLREALAHDVNRWNRLRDLMRIVTRAYSRLHPDSGIQVNAWEEAARLKVRGSDQNKAWPPHVLLGVMRSATPEFRALVRCLLLTGQRVSDVCAMRPHQYDQASRTIALTQHKTGTGMLMHVPDDLSAVLDAMRGRHPERLLVTPRGLPWDPGNARETLQGLRVRLGFGRYTLHGLRATGPTSLAQGGVDLSTIMAVTGHTTEAQLRRYLKGVERLPLARLGQEGIADRFKTVLTESLEGANLRSYSGTTGRAAAIAGVQGQSSRRKSTSEAPETSAKQVQNAKPGPRRG